MKRVLVCLFLAAITFVVFTQTVRFPFVNFDDNRYVYENREVTGGLSFRGVARAFTHADIYLWSPLTALSHMLDCQVFGLWAGGHHLTNVSLHAIAAILLFLVLEEMTGALWRCAFVAAVFAVHPLRVESVAWVAERKDVLTGVFFMVSLWAYVRYARNRWSVWRYVAGLTPFILSLMAKPMLITLPAVLLLLDYWPLRRFSFSPRMASDAVRAGQAYGSPARRPPLFPTASSALQQQGGRLVLEKAPFLLLSIVSCWVTLLGAARPGVRPLSSTTAARIGNALISYVTYIGQMFYPARLAVLYPFPTQGAPAWKTAGAVILLTGISLAAILLRRKWPVILVGWFWYLIMLLPVIGFIRLGNEAHADRYTYLPQIGLYLLITWVVADLAGGWRGAEGDGKRGACPTSGGDGKRSASLAHPPTSAIPARLLSPTTVDCGRWVLGSLAAIILGALIFWARAQTEYWRDSETLWRHALACTSGNFIAHSSLGNALFEKGRVDEALAHYRTAVELCPNYAKDRNNVGVALAKKGRPDEAIPNFRKGLEIDPNDPEIHNNLGKALEQTGHPDEAILEFKKAIGIKPDSSDAHGNLGDALAGQGRLDEAITQFQRALEIDPGNGEVSANFAKTLAQMGRTEEAVVQYRKALELLPNFAEACNNLAWILATSPVASIRDGRQAVSLAERAVKGSGRDDPMLLDTLSAAYAEAGRFPEALETERRALNLASGDSAGAALAGEIQGRIRLYESGVAYREGVRK